MSKNELPEVGDWEAVHAVVHDRMAKLDMTLARLSRESGVSETTIRYIRRREKRQRSTLVALSAALGWPYDYLVDVLRGATGPVAPRSLGDETSLKHLLRGELDPVTEKLNSLCEALYAVAGKVDVILSRGTQYRD